MVQLTEKEVNACDEAISLLNSQKQVEAVQKFTDILYQNDKISLAWNNRGLGLLQLGHPFDAILNVEKAVALEPDSAEFMVNLGACYAESEKMDDAITWYQKSIARNPTIAQTQMNMGNALKYKGCPEEALTYYRKCVELDPAYVDGHLVRAFGELNVGNYKEGWEEFEWRWKSNQLVPRGLALPDWQGEDLNGKILLIYSEQGHGDTLQFIRYASVVKEKYPDCKIWVEVRQPLARLVATVAGVDRVLTYGEEVPLTDCNYCVAVMSLPRICGTTMATIPWSGPYFKADKFRSGLWNEKLKAMPPGMLVGVCWAGMSRPGRPQADAIDKRRSTTLEMFAPLAKVNGISWVSLQKGQPRDQIVRPPAGMTIGDWSEEFDDFFDTAALINNLDLVITVDTAVVHLAAGLGKPTWLLSRWDGCWRWLNNRPDSPWYPTARVFGQPGPHQWAPMMENVASALREYVQMYSQKAA